MRRVCGWCAAAILGAVAIGSGDARGAPVRSGVRLDPLQPASPDSVFTRAEGPHAPGNYAVEYAVGLGLEYASRPLQAVGVDAAGEEHPVGDLVDHALLARIAASISPRGWLAVDMSLPVALYVKGKDEGTVSYGGQQASAPTSSGGAGDIRFGAHVRAVDTSAFGLFLGGRVWVPTGSEGAYLSDGRFRGEVDLGAAGEVGTLLYGATFSVSPGLFMKRDGDRGAAAFAAHVLPVPAFSMGVEPSVAVVYDEAPSGEGSMGLLVETLAAMRLRLGSVRLGIAGGPVFGGVAGSGEFRGLFSVALVGGGQKDAKKVKAKGPEDRDLDGISDQADACPDEAGPDSRDAAQRGCPASDQDADGVRDAEDSCPDRAGVKHEQAKANGCPDGDNDLLPDPIDSCAKEPGSDPFGCPRYARMSASGFKIKPPIKFRDDGEVTPESRLALEEVAATMRANPKLEQVSVQIGTKGASAQVSDKRARAILLIFRAGNLESDRYEVVLKDDLKAGAVEIRIVR